MSIPCQTCRRHFLRGVRQQARLRALSQSAVSGDRTVERYLTQRRDPDIDRPSRGSPGGPFRRTIRQDEVPEAPPPRLSGGRHIDSNRSNGYPKPAQQHLRYSGSSLHPNELLRQLQLPNSQTVNLQQRTNNPSEKREIARDPFQVHAEQLHNKLSTEGFDAAWGFVQSVFIRQKRSPGWKLRFKGREATQDAVKRLLIEANNSCRQQLGLVLGKLQDADLCGPKLAALGLWMLARGLLLHDGVDAQQAKSADLAKRLDELIRIWHVRMRQQHRAVADIATVVPGTPARRVGRKHGSWDVVNHVEHDDVEHSREMVTPPLPTERNTVVADLDWNFLPPPSWPQTFQLNKTYLTFEEIISSICQGEASVQDRQDRRWVSTARDDVDVGFGGPALVTAHLARRLVPAECSDSGRYGPFVRLIRIMWKLTNRYTGLPFVVRSAYLGAAGTEKERWEEVISKLGLKLPTRKQPEAKHLQATNESVGKQAADADIRPEHATVADEHVTVLGQDDAIVDTADPSAPHLSRSPIDVVSPLTAEDMRDITDPVTRAFGFQTISRIGICTSQANLHGLEGEWKAVLAHISHTPSAASALPLHLYEHFLFAFLILGQPAQAVSVWQHFVALGKEPRTRTWTVMMRGAQEARDIKTSEQFWQRMLSSGLKPDIHAWSTRIYGLFRTGNINAGIDGLRTMGSQWVEVAKAQRVRSIRALKGNAKEAAKATQLSLADLPDLIDGFHKPNVIVLNSAISGLNGSTRRDDVVPTVLQWARSFGLEPNLITYNTLLMVSLRQGRAEEAMKLLGRMREGGLQPDEYTWTLLLTSMFKNQVLDPLSKDEQESKIMSFIYGLEASGAECLNEKSYSLIVDRMLKLYDNAGAADAVLRHMRARHIPPSVHIYTILTTHYFAASPPNLPAVEALWSNIQSSDLPVDTLFLDRMLEGFSANGRITPALAILQRMSKQGLRPSWRALEMLTRALAEMGDWSTLASVVSDVRRQERLTSVGLRYMSGQRSFWEFVLETGILRSEGVRGLADLERLEYSGSMKGLGEGLPQGRGVARDVR